MGKKLNQAFFLSIYFISPMLVSVIYWLEEPLDSSNVINNLIHRTGSILGIFAFIWICFNIIMMSKIKFVEKNFNLDGIITFHTFMAAIALILAIIHYPLVRLERTYSSLQVRSGSIGFQILVILMLLAIIFMSNRFLKYNIIKILRFYAFRNKFRYNLNKILHNLMMRSVLIVFMHTFLAFTSQVSIVMRISYSFFFIITSISWFNHKLLRRFRSVSDPYIQYKASWDTITSKIITESDKDWAIRLIKQNPSLYPCLQCGICTINCPVSKVTEGKYNPRKNILYTLSGNKKILLNEDKIVIWGCTTCHNCDELCPQNIELTKTFSFLKNQSITQKNGPSYIYEQFKTIFENGKAIPLQLSIERRREELGLPSQLTPDINDIRTLL